MTRFRWGGHERMIAADNALKKQTAEDLKKIAERREAEKKEKKEVKEDVVSKMNAAARKEARDKKKANTVTQDTLSYLTTNAVKEKKMKKKEVKEETIPMPLEYSGEYSIRNIYETSKDISKDMHNTAKRFRRALDKNPFGKPSEKAQKEGHKLVQQGDAREKVRSMKEWIEEEDLEEGKGVVWSDEARKRHKDQAAAWSAKWEKMNDAEKQVYKDKAFDYHYNNPVKKKKEVKEEKGLEEVRGHNVYWDNKKDSDWDGNADFKSTRKTRKKKDWGIYGDSKREQDEGKAYEKSKADLDRKLAKVRADNVKKTPVKEETKMRDASPPGSKGPKDPAFLAIVKNAVDRRNQLMKKILKGDKSVKEETIPMPLEYGGEYSIRNLYSLDEISKEKTKQYISAAKDDRDEMYNARRDPDYYSSSYRGSGDPEGKAADDRILKNRRAGIKLAKKKLKEWLEEEQLDEAQIGHRVKIIQPKFGGSMKEFHGKTGTVTGIEKDGSTNMYRVKLDDPVDIPGVGKVSDDLWAGQHLKKISRLE